MYERRCILVLLDRSRTVRPLRGGTCESAKLRYWLGRKTRGKDRISRGATSFPARSCGRSSASVLSRSGAGGTTRKMAFPPPRWSPVASIPRSPPFRLGSLGRGTRHERTRESLHATLRALHSTTPRSSLGERNEMSIDALYRDLNKPSATPQATVEAIMVAVRERGLAALKDAANVERLARCDQAARAQINQRIARLIEHKGS